MSIDERLDKLTDRHEALAQSVELIGLHVDRLTEKVDVLIENVDKIVVKVDRLSVKVDALVESVQDLVRVARMHEGRIQRLEGLV